MNIQVLEATTPLTTGEELLAAGDIGRTELVEGRIVMLSPTGGSHGGVEVEIAAALRNFVKPRRLGRVLGGEVGIYTRRNPDTVRGADVLYISKERLARWKGRGYLDVAPDLIVEVLSPDDRWNEVTKKLQEYFDIGVRVVLVADPEMQQVLVYRSLTAAQVFNEDDMLTIAEVLPGFSVAVASLFEEA